MKSHTDILQGTFKPHLLGGVVLIPNMGWATWFNPLLALTSIPHRFASTWDQAANLVIELFQNAGITPPENVIPN